MPLQKDLPESLVTTVSEQRSIDEILRNLPDLNRDEIQSQTEKLLIAEMRGEIKLKSNQLSALTALARKYLENPPTIKEEDDPIDFLALLTETHEENAEAFKELSDLALSFREQENQHRESLIQAQAEIKEQELLGQHIPNTSAMETLQADGIPSPQNKKNVLSRFDPQSSKDNRFDEVVGLQEDGFPSSWPTDFIQHQSG